MHFEPLQNYIICKKIFDSHKVTGDLIFTKEEMPIFKVLIISKNIKNKFIKKDDCIIINSIGTRIVLNNKEYYLINSKNIIGIV